MSLRVERGAKHPQDHQQNGQANVHDAWQGRHKLEQHQANHAKKTRDDTRRDRPSISLVAAPVLLGRWGEGEGGGDRWEGWVTQGSGVTSHENMTTRSDSFHRVIKLNPSIV